MSTTVNMFQSAARILGFPNTLLHTLWYGGHQFQSAARILGFPNGQSGSLIYSEGTRFQSAARILGFPNDHGRCSWRRAVRVSVRRADSWLPKPAMVTDTPVARFMFQSAARILGFPNPSRSKHAR